MKVIQVLIVVLLVLTGCKKFIENPVICEPNPFCEIVEISEVNGTWKWESSSGGLVGGEIVKEDEIYLVLMNDYTYYWNVNGKLGEINTYQLETKVSTWNPDENADYITLNGTDQITGELFYQFDNGNLILIQRCNDCYMHKMVQVVVE